jgi:hypothetical protein
MIFMFVSFAQLFDDTNTAKSMVYVSPSVDLHGLRNPSMRVYELDDTTFELLDYSQYYFNLADASKLSPPSTHSSLKVFALIGSQCQLTVQG